MSDKEDLKFVDSGQDDVLFDKGDSHTHTFTNFPNSAADDDYDEDSEDKSQLLKDGKKSPSFWTFDYYQQFFNVETYQVGHRVLGSMLPVPTRNYLHTHIRPSPDLYGPFWICTTLVFTTAIAGNMANYLSSGAKDYQWRYDFHKVTFAAAAIFSYWWIIPALMYGLLWWRKSQAGYTFMEILCLYGYSMSIYIPISILWVINITWFKWLLVIIGAAMSGGVLVITLWPAVKEDTKQVALIIIGLVFLFHLMLAAGFVLYFFHVPAAAATTQPAVTIKPPVTKPEAAALKEQAEKNPVIDDKPKQGQPQDAADLTNELPNDKKGESPNEKPGTQVKDQRDKPVDKENDTDKVESGGVVRKDVSEDIEAAADEDKAQLDSLSEGKKTLVKRRSKLLSSIGRNV